MTINNINYNTAEIPFGNRQDTRSIRRAVLDRITSVEDRAFNFIESTVVNNIETFSQSHPRTVKTLKPAICGLLTFRNNNSALFVMIILIAIAIGEAASIILAWRFLEFLALSEITVAIGAAAMAPISLASLTFHVILVSVVFSKLARKQLNQSIEIDELTATFFRLDPEFVAALNEWSRNESRQLNSEWIQAREEIIYCYNIEDTSLSLEHFHLHSLPDIFDNPNFRDNLEQLYLHDNCLTRLPESIGNLQLLSRLNLADNRQLSGLHPSILQLPPRCIVDITNCNFSETLLATIREIVRDPNYAGPRISHSMRNSFNRFDIEPTIGQSLRNFYRISGKNYNGLPNLEEVPNLRLWLHKLTLVADFKGRSQQAFVTKIVEYLERANEDSSFRDVFSATISDAVNTCGDRVALSVLKLGITYKLSTIDLTNIQSVHHLLTRGVWALELLHEIARQKIPTLQMFDEIEVYLGYPVKLKEELDLPIDIDNMLYFNFSALTPSDLEIAKNSILSTINNIQEKTSFLIEQPQWLDALKLKYGEQFAAIDKEKERAQSLDDPDYIAIDNVYRKGLTDLTKQALQSFNS